MQKKMCVSKKTLLMIGILSSFTVLLLFLSSSLLKTKTNTKSRASAPLSVANPAVQAIHGGEAAEEGRWPFMVYIEADKFFSTSICGGTLIAPGWVLTATHCVIDGDSLVSPDSVTVYTGNNSLPVLKKSSSYTAEKVFLYPKYNPVKDFLKSEPVNDLALVKLSAIPIYPGDTEFLPTISLKIKENWHWEMDGQMSIALGWGITSPDQYSPNSYLLQVVLPIVVGRNEYITTDLSQLKAGYPDGSAKPCKGDSGGPLLVFDGTKYYEVGIVSKSLGCNIGYEIFTKITYANNENNINYLNWIISTINANGFPTGVNSSYKYEGMGTFVGTPLSNNEKKSYYKYICDKKTWDGQLPSVCPLNLYHGR